MEKKGLSGVITTLLIIGISLAAVIILWAVISNILNKESGEVNLAGFTININIKKVVSYENGIDVFVKRNAGQGNLSGIRFIISDGTNTYSFDKKDTPLNELEEKKFSINYTDPIKKISISPIIKLGSTETTQNPSDNLEYTAYNTIKNMPGLVSWWRFEGNANDEMGINSGLNYNIGNSTQGKFGLGYSFLDPLHPNSIPILNSPSLNLSNSNYTIISWINTGILSPGKRPIFWKGTGTGTILPSDEYGLIIRRVTVGTTQNLYGGTNKSSVLGNINITAFGDKWIQVANSQEFNNGGTTIAKVYVNGDLDNQATDIAEQTTSTSYNGGIGSSNASNFAFLGTIDEVMIFNRTLSDKDIKALYNLDLS